MKAKAKSVSAQPLLAVDSEVVRQIRQHARSCNTTEVCGVLIGRDRDHRVDVAACIEGENAEAAGAHVTFTQDTWEHIYSIKDKNYPDERIVGWYHSHPGFGVFLSDHDTFIHRNFFSSPGQVAWVFDPQSDEEGCFGWVDGRIERLTRIGVIDRRGGEPAEHSGPSEPMVSVGLDPLPIRTNRENEESISLKIRRVDSDESSDTGDSSLERLVFQVFFYLAVLALGFSLAYFLFPRVVLMPVMLDPRTGELIDAQTGQIVAVPRDSKDGKGGQPDPNRPASNKSPQPTPPDQSKKEDNAKPR
jgi:proteasome lid subunit RPN8/RPN11